jgi:predicted tellurium resistance membrane protein TerC
MLQLLGLNPYVKAAIGAVLAIAGIATHRVLLVVVGGVVVLWTLAGLLTGLLTGRRTVSRGR